MNSEIPREIEELHEGEWLVWDLDVGQLAGAAPDLDDLDAEVRSVQDASHEVYLHYVLPRGTVLAAFDRNDSIAGLSDRLLAAADSQ